MQEICTECKAKGAVISKTKRNTKFFIYLPFGTERKSGGEVRFFDAKQLKKQKFHISFSLEVSQSATPSALHPV